MKLDVIKLDGGKAGTIDLDEALFGLDPRADVLHRVVRWQRARMQAGTHSTLTRAEVSYSTKKIYKQKGTGGARHGSKKAPIFRHGGVVKGPNRVRTLMICRRNSALWVCVTLCPRRPKQASW